MPTKEGLVLSPKNILAIIAAIAALATATGVGGFSLSNGDPPESTMTMPEAEVWRAEKDRVEFVDSKIEVYGADIVDLQEDVKEVKVSIGEVQRTVNENTQTLRSIANRVGAAP